MAKVLRKFLYSIVAFVLALQLLTSAQLLATAEEESAAEVLVLDAFIALQDYTAAYQALKKQVSHLADEEIVKFLLESNKYTKWAKLLSPDRATVVAKVTKKPIVLPPPSSSASSSDTTPLDSFLAQKDYSGAYTSLKASGNQASDEELVTFLLTSNGYSATDWSSLSPSIRASVIAKVAKKPSVSPSSGSSTSGTGTATASAAAPAPALNEATETATLNKLLTLNDYSKAYRAIKKSGNKASDSDIVKYLLTTNGYSATTWDALSPDTRASVVAKVTLIPCASSSTAAPVPLSAAALQEQEAARQAFLKSKLTRNTFSRCNLDQFNFGVEGFPAYDLGYQGLSRSQQFSPPLEDEGYDQGFHMPAAPVCHPYNPTEGGESTGYASLAFPLNVKLPKFKASFAPAALNSKLAALAGMDLASVETINPDTFFVVQDLPAGRGLTQTSPIDSLLLRPQSWLYPNAPYTAADAKQNRAFRVTAGVWSGGASPQPLLVGQTADDLVTVGTEKDMQVSVHLHHGIMTSSGASFPFTPLNLKASKAAFSLVKDVFNDRYAVTCHIFLNKAGMAQFRDVLKRRTVTSLKTLRDELVKDRLARRRINLGGGQDMVDALDTAFGAP